MSKTKNVYIHELPPVVLYDFTRLMDTLSQSDWIGFASHVVLDQTELRLIERYEDRTNRLMNIWSCRNGTVSDLLTILTDLKMYRARDIIFNWMQTQSPPSEQPPCPPRSPPRSSFSPPSSLFYPVKEPKHTKPVSESKHLPLPGPPPAELVSHEGRKPTALPEASSAQPASLKSVDLYNSLSSCAMCWSFEEIQRGTENFSLARQIGEGGFGMVYRATMRNTDYAVKKLKEDSQLDWTLVKQSFKTEVEKLSLYRHPNILDFAGYSIGEGTHCLLYAFMPNGSLEDRLHCQDIPVLSWSQRLGALMGAAKALQFLHSWSPQVIHGDVKSSNILLGEHFEPKLGDFGLARLCQTPGRATGKTTTVAQTKTVRGTLAYLPDEYLKDGLLGVEIDVYSFGVVLLEVLTGRRALEVTDRSKAIYLKDLVAELEDEGQSTRTGKNSQTENISTAAQHICRNHLDSKVVTGGKPVPSGALEIAQLACQCLHRRRKKRPLMAEVFKTLQNNYKNQMYTCRSINISSELPQPPPPQTPAWTDTSVEALRSEFTKLGPQEDTYCCTQHVHVPSLSSMAYSSEFQKDDGSKETLGMYFSHRFPCESDESQGFSQYFSSSDSSTLPKSNIPGTIRSLGDGDYSSSGSQAGLSQTSSAAGSSSEGIVVNAAKQQLVHKMALYEKGLLASSGLFSSGSGSYGEESTQSQEPVESEEFEY
ncbi:interleukin-1 receptor-associated kinase 1 isoform X1 [Alosa sapidissima]|uniref:interleukin-1 receptor-associated kinase 1 isoform X1 n=1 Tax=Alosa sapidissima TaxID=34773 RepID=UPI001C090D29|nr:interleukin-1 receptor-associated kinase 1 isoform X1 [Alosa sapidissima]